MAEEERDEAIARLAAVRERFAGRLRERIAEIETALASARTGDAAELEHAVTLVHKLAGTAGSFGHARTGEIAGRLEALLVAGRAGPADWDALDRAREALAASLAPAE